MIGNFLFVPSVVYLLPGDIRGHGKTKPTRVSASKKTTTSDFVATNPVRLLCRSLRERRTLLNHYITIATAEAMTEGSPLSGSQVEQFAELTLEYSKKFSEGTADDDYELQHRSSITSVTVYPEVHSAVKSWQQTMDYTRSMHVCRCKALSSPHRGIGRHTPGYECGTRLARATA